MYYNINMRIIYIIFIVVFIFNSCQNKAKSLYEKADLLGTYQVDELPPLIFPNIQEVNRYITQNIQNNDIEYNAVLDSLHKNFMNTDIYGLLGYNWYSGIILADLDKDRTYELYLNASIGSGIVHSFIHCYNPRTEKYYILSKRTECDYLLFIHNNILYVLSSANIFSKNKNVEIFEPKLLDDEIILKEIKENIQNEIIGSIEIGNIYHPFEGDLIRNNIYK